jgi:hypothetical protein
MQHQSQPRTFAIVFFAFALVGLSIYACRLGAESRKRARSETAANSERGLVPIGHLTNSSALRPPVTTLRKSSAFTVAPTRAESPSSAESQDRVANPNSTLATPNVKPADALLKEQSTGLTDKPFVGASIVQVPRAEYIKKLEELHAQHDLILTAKSEDGDVIVLKPDAGVSQLAANEVQIQGCNLSSILASPVVVSVNKTGVITSAQNLDGSKNPIPSQLATDCRVLPSADQQSAFITVLTPAA